MDFLRPLPNLIYATIIHKQEAILKALGFRTGPYTALYLIFIYTGVFSELSLKVLILTLNDAATHLLKANCLKRVLRLRRCLHERTHPGRDEFHPRMSFT